MVDVEGVEPDPGFADRLEAALLRRLGSGRPSTLPATSGDEEEIMTVDRLEAPTRRNPRLAIAAAALVALGLAGAAVALTSVDDPVETTADRGRVVAFDITWPDLDGLETARCLETDVIYDWAPDGHCVRRFEGEVQLDGDLAGTALWTMEGNLGLQADPEDSAVLVPATFNATYLVRATVEGCGTGEFMIAEQLRFDGFESGGFSGTWQVLPGSGRDDLASIAGGGAVPGDAAGAATTQATRTGRISCDG